MSELKQMLLPIEYTSQEEINELSEILQDLKTLNDINNDLSIILDNQNEQLEKIEDNQQINIDLTEKSVNELESAVRNKTKLIPMVVGAAVGAAVCGPGALALGVKVGTGYIVAGGSVLGSIAAKNIT
mgnify:CR=1 FL=1|jgi:hypothetical protein